MKDNLGTGQHFECAYVDIGNRLLAISIVVGTTDDP